MAVKPQLACFERLGAPGWAALAAVAEHARAAGLLVLADGKRGDIDVTAAAYGQALVGATPTPAGEVRGLGADAFTANPYLGRDTVAVLVAAARAAGAGVFVLVRTSNPGAADVQDLPLAGGGTVWEAVARLVAALGAQDGDDGPLSDVGAVAGATAPEHLGGCASCCRAPPSCCPAWARRAAGWRTSPRPGRPGARAASSRPRGPSSAPTRTPPPARPTPRPPRARRPSACGRPPGRSRPPRRPDERDAGAARTRPILPSPR